ncbi:MAG TPA: formate dehydrogenase accessory protein FdhE [Actinophytocola sp.]|uniref:formate dehydrogenase accessory protein FdhE domain-containing protein n=1 Tax=Actinophytocola sp. TaxID=1872138 RepID=UPI002DDDBC9D|nr:formate dehydrogenase accessory protein FdhE [Actinophytocola sp.]HEV2780042.1 formate dehydrogenase accessory protein FdhE [Actinophytocola sp.]
MNPWAAPRRRAEALRERYSFAAELLTLYLALLEVWQEAWAAARAQPPDALAGWAAHEVMPKVVAATAESGPEPLARSLAADLDGAEELLAAWLAGEELVPVERYLARATLHGPLRAVDAAAACAGDPSPRGDRRCPRCGGPPQLSFHTETGDRLVSGHRKLQCARCAESWSFSSSSCAYCGEAKRTVYAEQTDGPRVGRPDAGGATFPHIRLEACTNCRRYLIDVDLGRDPKAVPEVDELAALPLDLYATEQGFSKITPNVMGF